MNGFHAPPRVLHVIRPANLTGAPAAMAYLLEEMARTEFEFEVVCGPDSGLVRRLTDAGIECRVCRHLVREPAPLRDARAVLWLYRYIAQRRFDIVHTHSSKSGVLGRWAAKWAGVPAIIHTFNGIPWIGARGFALIERLTARISDALIAVSDSDKAHLLDLGIADSDRINVIPNGLPAIKAAAGHADLAGELGFSAADPIVGWFGRLKTQKNPPLLIETARKVLEVMPECRFVVVGDGELLPAARAQAQAYGIHENLYFLGWRDDPLTVMNACDLMLLTSSFEGLPVVAVEAAFLGVPVVATDVRGNRDVVVDGQTGLLEAADPAALAQAIVGLLADAGLRERMSAAARDRAATLYDIRQVAAATADLYRRVSGSRQPAVTPP